jgi:hypothetical protein
LREQLLSRQEEQENNEDRYAIQDYPLSVVSSDSLSGSP